MSSQQQKPFGPHYDAQHIHMIIIHDPIHGICHGFLQQRAVHLLDRVQIMLNNDVCKHKNHKKKNKKKHCRY